MVTLRSVPDLSIVVPLFNEQENIREVHRRVSDSLAALGRTYELAFVASLLRDEAIAADGWGEIQDEIQTDTRPAASISDAIDFEVS